jgi:hypothetical protein
MSRRVARIARVGPARLALLVSAALLGAGPARAATPGADAFEKLKTLAGDWEAKTPKGSILKLSYRLVSRDSVLVETWAPGSKGETLTVYHLDGPALLATHYCAQGNQPRLELKSAGEGGYEFVFRDATNLAKSADSHMHRLLIRLVDADHFTKKETYVEDDKEDATELHFTRVGK